MSVVLVTGAASGIGGAVASSLRDNGWTVAGLDLQPAAGVALALTADVSDPAAVAAAVRAVREGLGPIDALVTAAGHYEMLPVSEISPESWHRMLRVHLGGLRNCLSVVLPDMLDRGRGSVVAVTSELAIGGGDGDAHYAAAKGAIIGLVRSLATEVAPRGVRVNAVAPGPTDTPLLSPDSPWRDREFLATVPNRRLTRPDEIAAVVRFLLDEGNFCIGEVISPNGGVVI
ncbi:SDR family oxidoreductase [Planosporangium thailandense]|uniref:SDR family oxidoreductase n=1 Tax=Planosporangium thailandense TaxID=765197 RepID=A0ABX0XTR3_9ACTN|nr:SDR family oxidoreductase [Planosporangium thailandense]NJC68618.1 SDR family oxidoreductase [Planosporangium thailandense]